MARGLSYIGRLRRLGSMGGADALVPSARGIWTGVGIAGVATGGYEG